MPRAPKISRAHAIALPRPAPATVGGEWIAAGIAVALLLLGLLL